MVMEEAIIKTTSITRYDSFEFLIMPFGMTNAPTIFYMMIKLLKEHLDKFVMV